jgi:hypothetical protein
MRPHDTQICLPVYKICVHGKKLPDITFGFAIPDLLQHVSDGLVQLFAVLEFICAVRNNSCN